MKNTTFILMALVFITLEAFAQEFTVMTYNIRYDNQWDTLHSWEKRKAAVFKEIEESNADVFGVQEALYHQIEDLELAFPEFERVGVGREDGKAQGEFSAVFFRKEMFELQSSETFWLSETPEKPSVGWDAALERICTMAFLTFRQGGDSVLIMNTHFDHQGEEARSNSMWILIHVLAAKPQADIREILMGDFNLEPNEKPIQRMKYLMTDTYAFAKDYYDSIGTFNGFQKDFSPKRIDYIFSKNLNVLEYRISTNSMDNGNFPSDHFPVISRFKL